MADSPTFNSCAFVISTQPYLQTTPLLWLALPGHHTGKLQSPNNILSLY